MKIVSIKYKLLAIFAAFLLAVTLLNALLASYLINRESQAEAYNRLSRELIVFQNDLQEMRNRMSNVSMQAARDEKNLSDMAVLYSQLLKLKNQPSAPLDSAVSLNRVTSLNRLQLILLSARLSSVAVYLDDDLSHFVTPQAAGMIKRHDSQTRVVGIQQYRNGKVPLDDWRNWSEIPLPGSIHRHFPNVDRVTVSFDFPAQEVIELHVIVPIQGMIRQSFNEVIAENLSIATPTTALQAQLTQEDLPVRIGMFVFTQVFDKGFLQNLTEKTGLLPAIISADGQQRVQLVDLATPTEVLSAQRDPLIQLHTVNIGGDSYYQASMPWQIAEDGSSLILSQALSRENTIATIRQTVMGIIAASVFILVLGGAVGYSLISRIVAPIRALTRAVSAMGLEKPEMVEEEVDREYSQRIALRRYLQHPIAPQSEDEISELTSVFNNIAGQLHALIGGLEAKVNERTHELADSNRQLLSAKEHAESASRAKSAFLANMSHELRTPLNAILGFSELMTNNPLLHESLRENIEIISRSGKHLLALINDVLDMAKIEAGQVNLENAAFDLGTLVRDIIDMMQQRAFNKGLQLRIDQSSLFPRFIVGDQARLRQILINLVSNAIKNTEQGGVTLRLDTKDNKISHLLIDVEDTGIGIAVEDQQKVFEPFVQLGEQGTNKGTGLGLTITRQFVKMMGGNIWLESAPGKGSLFRLDLPLIEAQEADITMAEQVIVKDEVMALAPDQGEYRILIVEDQRDNQLLLSRFMESVGFKVRIAENGEQGVQLFESWHPHFIWMDRRMPVMDGIQATRRIRELAGGKEVKIAAVTASAFDEERDEMLASGMDDYVRKPYRPGEIYDCLSRQLGVKYLYESAVESDVIEPDISLTPQMLNSLPEALRNEFVEVLESLESKRIEAVIQQVSMHDQELQSKLTQLARNFDYTTILKALKD